MHNQFLYTSWMLLLIVGVFRVLSIYWGGGGGGGELPPQTLQLPSQTD